MEAWKCPLAASNLHSTLTFLYELWTPQTYFWIQKTSTSKNQLKVLFGENVNCIHNRKSCGEIFVFKDYLQNHNNLASLASKS